MNNGELVKVILFTVMGLAVLVKLFLVLGATKGFLGKFSNERSNNERSNKDES